MPKQASNYLRHPRVWQFVLACYWAILFVATHRATIPRVLPGRGSDKLAHVSAFAVLAAIFAITWQLSSGRLIVRHLCWIWVVVAIYGALDEWTQIAVGRNASARDWAADAIGAALGLLLFHWLQRSRRRRSLINSADSS